MEALSTFVSETLAWFHSTPTVCLALAITTTETIAIATVAESLCFGIPIATSEVAETACVGFFDDFVGFECSFTSRGSKSRSGRCKDEIFGV
jgi:hypothetical protein